jgi:polysaccharide export outer membrane protein
MRLSFNRPIFILKGIALLAVLALFAGCTTTTSPEPAFQDYEPGAWTPPGQTTNTVPAQPVAEPAPEPAEAAPAGLTDIFRVGDTVTVQVTGVASEIIPPHEERIKDDGSISLYLLGTVQAAGRTQGDLQRELQTEYERFFKNPVVTVNTATRFYYVGGEVKRPGAQPYLGITTVTKAIQSAGDFTDFGKKTSIRVIRADGTSLKVNFNKAIEEPSLDPPIYPGDKIHVPRRILW